MLFKNQPDLVRKIKYYLSHTKARQKIAAAGYKRAHRDHTYQKRFLKVQQLLKGLPSAGTPKGNTIRKVWALFH